MTNHELDNSPLVTPYVRPVDTTPEPPAPHAEPPVAPTEVQPALPEAAPVFDKLSVLNGIRVAILTKRSAHQARKADETLSSAESGVGTIDAVINGGSVPLASRPVTSKEVRRYEKAERHKRKAMKAGFTRIGEAQTHGRPPGTRGPLYERGIAPAGKEFRESDIGTQEQLDRLERGTKGPAGGNLMDQVDQGRYSRAEIKGEMRSRTRYLRAVDAQTKHNDRIAKLKPGADDTKKARKHISNAKRLEARIAEIRRKDREKRSAR